MDLKMESNKENNRLEGEDNGRRKNVEDKRSPEDMLNEIQLQKTHDLYCPKCIHNITETAKLFKKKGEASSPYNEDKFIWWFVIVISFKYPFIYLPWLYNNTPGASEPTHSVVGETHRKHILDWLWQLLVVVLLLLSVIVLWILFSPKIPPLPPSPPPHTNGDSTNVIPEPEKLQEDVIDVHGHVRTHVPEVMEHDRPISPSLPPVQLHTDISSTNLITGSKIFTEDVAEIQGHLQPHVSDVLLPDSKSLRKDAIEIRDRLKPHVSDVVVDDIPIPPSLPPPLSSAPPHTDDSLTVSVHDPKTNTKDVSEIQRRPEPPVPDVVINDTTIPPSQPPLVPPPLPHTNISSAVLILELQSSTKDITEIQGHLKSRVTDDVVDDRPIPSSLPPPMPSPPPYNDASSTVLIPAPTTYTEDVFEIQDHLKSHVSDDVVNDISIPPAPQQLLPPPKPHTSDTTYTEDVFEIQDRLKSHVLYDVVNDIPIPPAPQQLLPPPKPHTSESLKILILGSKNLREDVTEIQGILTPQVSDVLIDNIPIPSSSPPLLLPSPPPPHSDEILTVSIPSPATYIEDVLGIQGHLKPHVLVDGHIQPSSQHVSDVVVDDIPIPPSLPPLLPPPLSSPPPHTDESLTVPIHGPKTYIEDVLETQGCLEPHVLDIVVDDIPIPPSLPPILPPPLPSPPPHTDESLTVPIYGPKTYIDDVHETQGCLEPWVSDVPVDDTPNRPPPQTPLPPPPPHTDGSLIVSIPELQTSTKDVTEIQDLMKPHVSDVVVDDTPIQPSPPPQPHTDEILDVLVPEIDGSLKLHGPEVVKDDKPIMPSLPLKFPSNIVISVISLLLLAILIMCWSSISWTMGTKTEDVDTTSNLPNLENLQNGEAQDSTSKPGILWKHIVVPVQNVVHTELDILKSIVYGGLIESITSFGVVSSAAASGTSVFNVLALGLANLFSGLLLIIYNLYRLVTSKPFDPSANIDHMRDEKATDPYKELLGNRNNVILHCFVVVVSFISFGVIPPLFYGFSFIITDNGYYVAGIVISAALFCVISLSFAKAYAFSMDKVKTVAVYNGIAIGASVISFVASQHVRDLLEKYEFLKIDSDYRTW